MDAERLARVAAMARAIALSGERWSEQAEAEYRAALAAPAVTEPDLRAALECRGLTADHLRAALYPAPAVTETDLRVMGYTLDELRHIEAEWNASRRPRVRRHRQAGGSVMFLFIAVLVGLVLMALGYEVVLP